MNLCFVSNIKKCAQRSKLLNVGAIDETLCDYLRSTTAKNWAQFPICNSWTLYVHTLKVIPRSTRIPYCFGNISSRHFCFSEELFWLNLIMVQLKPIAFKVSLEARLHCMTVSSNTINNWYPNSWFNLVYRGAALNKATPHAFGLLNMTTRSKSVPKIL